MGAFRGEIHGWTCGALSGGLRSEVTVAGRRGAKGKNTKRCLKKTLEPGKRYPS